MIINFLYSLESVARKEPKIYITYFSTHNLQYSYEYLNGISNIILASIGYSLLGTLHGNQCEPLGSHFQLTPIYLLVFASLKFDR